MLNNWLLKGIKPIIHFRHFRLKFSKLRIKRRKPNRGCIKNDTLDTHVNKHELGGLRDIEGKIAFDKMK